jgi:hypothetical protein
VSGTDCDICLQSMLLQPEELEAIEDRGFFIFSLRERQFRGARYYSINVVECLSCWMPIC